MSWVAGSDRLALSARPRSVTFWSARNVSRSAAGGGEGHPSLEGVSSGEDRFMFQLVFYTFYCLVFYLFAFAGGVFGAPGFLALVALVPPESCSFHIPLAHLCSEIVIGFECSICCLHEPEDLGRVSFNIVNI